MKNISIKNLIAATVALVAFSACYDDKGNYDYTEVPVITAENLPEKYEVIQKVDEIVVNPTIISSIEGEIKEGNPNYDFECCILSESNFTGGGRTKDINPDHKKSFTYLPVENTGTYNLWYKVTDKRTGVTSHFTSKLIISSATSKGWLVLGDEGDDNKVRVDLLSDLGNGREGLVHDVMGPDAPVLHNANHITFYFFAQYCDILVSTEEGSYYLDKDNLTTSEKRNVNSQFIVSPKDDIVTYASSFGYYSSSYMITKNGNIYTKTTAAGAMYETPCNTTTMYGEPTYRVAPFVGYYPGDFYASYSALFYDIDNNRFLARYCANNAYMLSIPSAADQPDPADRGTKIVHMSGTQFSNGTAYTVLENTDNGQRYLYGHNIMTNNFSSGVFKTLDKKMTAAGFDKAKFYAFHSQYPYCFYDNGNDIQVCNYMTNDIASKISIPANEEITMIKQNMLLSKYTAMTGVTTNPDIAPYDFCIMVGSYDKSDPVNGGVLRIYQYDDSTKSLILKKEAKGFAKIRDVVYRERP